MAKRSGILTGTAGVFHVASQLAFHDFHAAVTFGNAPSVDILVGLLDGGATLSLQVKTSRWAMRTRGRGGKKQPHHYEWDVGEKSGTLEHPDLLFAFVDLRGLREQELPEVFIVPSKHIFQAFDWHYFKSGIPRRWRWHPRINEIEPYKNDWDALRNHLTHKAQAAGT